MKKLIDLPEDSKFYRGTIIIIKDAEITPKGIYDKVYCMIGGFGGFGGFGMLDLYRSIGGCIIHDLKSNVKGHVAVDKQGIFDWVKEYYENFYTEEGKLEWIPKIKDIVYVDDLSNHFTQANRDLFME